MSDRIYELFDQLADLPRAERDARLESLAGADPTLADRLSELAEQLDLMPTGFLSSGDPVDAPHGLDEPPARIGRYAVIGELGRGGMGLVYAGQQENPRRPVAIKVLRADLVRTSAARRFAAEAEVLGRLEHAGIAHVYEAGTHTEGERTFPFIAMELVDGVALDKHVERGVAVSEVVELVAEVCDAVQHAHQNGIIHRDLKPSNIIVQTVDGRARPRVLDFGIARLVDDESRKNTFETGAGQILGTLSYMSPEQVRGAVDVDTRTDVYALGMILYRLLGRKLPFDVTSVSLPEAARIISEEEPTRLGRLQAELSGDLETIVTKCLEKDRDRRYASAAEVAADLRRHLADEPIQARPASLGYQLKKLARRRRGLVLGLAAALASLVLGLAATSYAFVEARAQRDRAERALAQEQVARRASDAASGFLAEVMTAVRPAEQGRAVTLKQVVDRAGEQLEARFAAQPDIRALLHGTLGRTYIALGDYDKAKTHVASAVRTGLEVYGPSDPRVLEARNMLGEVAYFQGDYARARDEFAALLAGHEATEPPDPVGLGTALGNLGFIEMKLEHLDEAERLLVRARRTLEPVRTSTAGRTAYLDGLGNLSSLYERREMFDRAEEISREQIAASRALLGPDHPSTLLAIANLAATLISRKDHASAVPLLEETLAAQRRTIGPSHSKTLITVHNLGRALVNLDRADEGVRMLKEGLTLAEEAYGPQSSSTDLMLTGLGVVHRQLGDFERADAYLQRRLRLAEAAYPVGDFRRLKARGPIAQLRFAEGRHAEAAGMYEAMLREIDARFPASRLRWVWRLWLAKTLKALDRPDEAKRWTDEANALRAPPKSP